MKLDCRILVMLGGAYFLTNVSAGPHFPVWSEVDDHTASTARAEQKKKQRVKINHDLFASALEDTQHQDHVPLSFLVHGKELVCNMRQSALLSPELATKYKEIKALTGACDDGGSSVSLVYNIVNRGSLSTTLVIGGRLYYVDHEDEERDLDTYSLFKLRDMDNEKRHFNETGAVAHAKIRHGHLRAGREQLQKGYIFRMAILTTEEFSALLGTTRSQVLTGIAALLARVNGIYLREVAVMFQLIPNTDDLICLGEDDCKNWENDNGGAFLNAVTGYMNGRGVSPSQYDIGHGLTGISGNAGNALGQLCTSDKAKGVTGGPNPIDDYFFVDFVAHEIGHQLGADHTFRDCPTDKPAHNPPTAIEPGSGTSIMSYAGGCETAVQARSDPFFNSMTLVHMRDFIEEKAPTCGVNFLMENEVKLVKPVVVSTPTCKVPKGNYVQLGGHVTNIADMKSDVFYAWDRVDPGLASFSDRNVPRFVPHEPTRRSPLRFLPNMYLLSFGLVDRQLEEIHPSESVAGDVSMVFRFIARTHFDLHATADNLDYDMVGAFGYHDVALTYDSSVSPLRFTTPIHGPLLSSTEYTLTWSGGSDLTSQVEMLFAINTMFEVSYFDYDSDVWDLDWVSMGVFDSSHGSGTVMIPEVDNPDSHPINIMIRSVGSSSDCYFFDLMPGLVYTRRPVALCQDVIVSADETCSACVTADQVYSGPFDPQGGDFTLMKFDSNCFSGLGRHDVTLTATDNVGVTTHCSAVITIVDDTPPEAICLEGCTSVGGKKQSKTAKQKKGKKCGKKSSGKKGGRPSRYYTVAGSDNCQPSTPPTISLFDSGSPSAHEFVGPFNVDGTFIKYTDSPDELPEQLPGSEEVAWLLKGEGDLHVQVTDGAGLVTTIDCPPVVPPDL